MILTRSARSSAGLPYAAASFPPPSGTGAMAGGRPGDPQEAVEEKEPASGSQPTGLTWTDNMSPTDEISCWFMLVPYPQHILKYILATA